MATRTANAEWKGNLKEGKGTVKLGSGAFEGSYSFASRFEEGKGTNPEELIAAAHAGCFSMALAAGLAAAVYDPQSVETTAKVTLEKEGEGFAIKRSELITRAQIPNITDEDFQTQANNAKQNCPVSRALAALEITLDARLVTG